MKQKQKTASAATPSSIMGRKPVADRKVEIRLFVNRSDIERHTGMTIKSAEEEKIAASAMREVIYHLIKPEKK